MGEVFINTFVKHMDGVSKLNVYLAEEKLALLPSRIYVSSKRCRIIKSGSGYSFSINKLEKNDYNPNINELFLSCSSFSNNIKVLAIILTGIGDDGALGVEKLCSTNASCITESEESAVVYGMPQRAKEMSPRVESQSLDEIVQSILKFGA
jgi:two-component system chemotaxis response regulator CheB